MIYGTKKNGSFDLLDPAACIDLFGYIIEIIDENFSSHLRVELRT